MLGGPRIIDSDSQHQIVCEIPSELLAQEEHEDLDPLIAGVFRELTSSVSSRDRKGDANEHEQVSRDALAQLLADSGWPLSSNEDELEVALAITDEYLSAQIINTPDGVTVSTAVVPGSFESAPRICRDAVMVLLWLTASRFRLVKPTLNAAGPSLEVVVARSLISASALSHACAALSACAQALSAETAMLVSDEQLAQIYLTSMGFECAA